LTTHVDSRPPRAAYLVRFPVCSGPLPGWINSNTILDMTIGFVFTPSLLIEQMKTQSTANYPPIKYHSRVSMRTNGRRSHSLTGTAIGKPTCGRLKLLDPRNLLPLDHSCSVFANKLSLLCLSNLEIFSLPVPRSWWCSDNTSDFMSFKGQRALTTNSACGLLNHLPRKNVAA